MILSREFEAHIAAERIIDMVRSAGFDITNPYSIINADWSMFPDDMRFGYGASRLVIWDEDYCDYVIKIALHEDYEKYCQHEVDIYEAAAKEGLADKFAWCCCYSEPERCGDMYMPGIYVMEYVDCDEDAVYDSAWVYGYKSYCEMKGIDSSNYDHAEEYNNWNWRAADDNEMIMDYLEGQVSEEKIRAFNVFMAKWQITDIHSQNVGFKGNRMVMVDYAGWNWQKGVTMDMWFDDDICWCADSDRCKNTECFRHMSNRRSAVAGPDIFTCACLMSTEICPLTEEGEN